MATEKESPSNETSSGNNPAASPAGTPAPVPPPPPAAGTAPAKEGEVLDATVPDPGVAAPSLTEVPSKRFDPNELLDQARKRITYWLLFLLTLLFVGAFGSLFLLRANRPLSTSRACWRFSLAH